MTMTKSKGQTSFGGGRLDKRVRQWEKERFPEFREDKLFAPPGNCYFYFGPSWHIASGLLNRQTLNGMKSDESQILSVGSGKAYLERFLVEGCGIDRQRITLCDIEPAMPEGFSSFIFDMYKSWPPLGKSFDYILFPESVMPFARHAPVHIYGYPDEMVMEMSRLIRSAVTVLKPEGEIRMSLSNCKHLVDLLRSQNIDLGRPSRRMTFQKDLLVVDAAT
jgi:hypothetical protein